MFEDICRGDQEALHVCWSLFRFLHVLDDMFDGDQEFSARAAGLSFLDFTETVACNPFFQAHRDLLCGSMRVALVEWIDSEAWRTREDLREKVAAEVLKSQYQNIFFLIASLVGGLPHMAAMSAKWRDYNWD
jgi:hypothetical protein